MRENGFYWVIRDYGDGAEYVPAEIVDRFGSLMFTGDDHVYNEKDFTIGDKIDIPEKYR